MEVEERKKEKGKRKKRISDSVAFSFLLSPFSFTTLRRLLRLYALYARLDLIFVTRDMKLFLLWMLTDAVMGIAMITSIWLLSIRFTGIGIWSHAQIVFLLGYSAVVGALIDVGFNYNVSHISRRLGRGQFDHSLIQPQPIWMGLLTEGFAPFSASLMLLPGMAMMAWAGRQLSMGLHPLWLLKLLFSLLCSAVVMLAFQFIWGSLAFWAPRSAEEISSSTARLMNELKPYPLDGLSGLMAGGLLTVLPVGFVAWYPCRLLLGLENAPAKQLLTPLAALLLTLFATFVFQQGRKHYARVGSQRYSELGHRG